MTIFQEALKLLRLRGVEFVDKFMPPLLSSFACHLLNLKNRNQKFFYENDRIPDLRMHVMIVSPPGFGRSFAIKQLMDPEYGLLNAGIVPMLFQGYTTEAGMIGSNERIGGQVTKIKGLFEEYWNGILGFEEFFAITQAMEQKHSLAMEPALNQALLDGDVRKRLRSGAIEYHTDVTIWGGTQITRFKVGGGLLRRFLLVNWVPSRREEKVMQRAIWKGSNLKLDPSKLQQFKSELINFDSELDKIRRIEFSDDLKNELAGRVHYLQKNYRKLAIGYNLLSQPIERTLYVDTDPYFSLLLKKADLWRISLIGDPEGNSILEVVREHNGRIRKDELKRKLIDFSLKFEVSDRIIKQLISTGDLVFRNGILYTREEWNRGVR